LLEEVHHVRLVHSCMACHTLSNRLSSVSCAHFCYKYVQQCGPHATADSCLC
jgi:hypothetical protein